MPQNIETFLRNLQTTDAIRADAWDTVYGSDEPAEVEQRLRSLKGLSDGTKAQLWDLRFPSPAAESQATDSGAPGRAALKQSEDAPLSYLAETASNVPRSFGRAVKDTVLGVVALAPHVARMAYGGNTPFAALAGTSPAQMKESRDIAANMLPGVVQAYSDRYGSPEARAQTVRDDPAGMVSDMAAIVVPARAATRGVGNIARKGAEASVRRVLPTSVTDDIRMTQPFVIELPPNAAPEARELADALNHTRPRPIDALKQSYANQQRAVEAVLREGLHLLNALHRAERVLPDMQRDAATAMGGLLFGR